MAMWPLKANVKEMLKATKETPALRARLNGNVSMLLHGITPPPLKKQTNKQTKKKQYKKI